MFSFSKYFPYSGDNFTYATKAKEHRYFFTLHWTSRFDFSREFANRTTGYSQNYDVWFSVNLEKNLFLKHIMKACKRITHFKYQKNVISSVCLVIIGSSIFLNYRNTRIPAFQFFKTMRKICHHILTFS